MVSLDCGGCLYNAILMCFKIQYLILSQERKYTFQKNQVYLTEVIQEFKRNGIRTSIVVDQILEMVEGAKKTGTDRVELYTEAFAFAYSLGNASAIVPYYKSAVLCNEIGLGINAGHDLSLENIKFFKENIPGLLEVSIGHALVSEALYLGLDNVVNMYLQKLK